METIPGQYKQVDKELNADMDSKPKISKSQKKKQKELAKNTNLSMVELKERAQSRIEQIQQTNREKSVAKI